MKVLKWLGILGLLSIVFGPLGMVISGLILGFIFTPFGADKK